MILGESPFHLSILRWRPQTLTWWPWPPPDLCKRLKWWKIRQWQCLTCLTEVFKAGDVFCLPKGVVFSKGWRVREKKDCKHIVSICVYTVDGWNPANQLRLVVFSHFLQGFLHPSWLAGFLPSTVCEWSPLQECFIGNDPSFMEI